VSLGYEVEEARLLGTPHPQKDAMKVPRNTTIITSGFCLKTVGACSWRFEG
jgi:hypothetical protein